MGTNADLLTSIKQQIEQKQHLEQVLCELTAISPDERSALLADPKGYLADRCGQPLPEGLKVVVHEDTANELHIVIPSEPAPTDELTDDQLAGISGGFGFVAAITKIAVVALTTYATAKVSEMTKKNVTSITGSETAGEIAGTLVDVGPDIRY